MRDDELKRVLVLGESNSVLRGGWTKGLSDALSSGFVVDNYGIGSTGILNAIFHLASGIVDPCHYDVIIIDSMINDRMFYRSSKRHLKYIAHTVRYIKAVCSNIIFVNFERALKRPDPLKKIVQKTCEEVGVLFYDTAILIAEMAWEKGSPIEALYQDSAHPSPSTGYQIGMDIAALILTLPDRDGIQTDLPFAAITADIVPAQNRVTFKNSLISLAGFTVLNDRLCIQTPKELVGSKIIAAIYNVAGSSGALEIHSFGSCKKRLSDPERYSPTKLLLWGRPIRSWVWLGKWVTLCAVNGVRGEENTEFCKRASSANTPVASIAALLVRKGLLWRLCQAFRVRRQYGEHAG